MKNTKGPLDGEMTKPQAAKQGQRKRSPKRTQVRTTAETEYPQKNQLREVTATGRCPAVKGRAGREPRATTGGGEGTNTDERGDLETKPGSETGKHRKPQV